MTDTVSAQVRAAVLALLAAAKYAKDDEDEATFAACWATNARLEITSNGQSFPPVAGHDAIMAFYRKVWATGGHGLAHGRETHVAEHPHIVALAANRVLARHAASFFNWRDGGPVLIGYGSFRDEIVHENGAWRIALRQSTVSRRK